MSLSFKPVMMLLSGRTLGLAATFFIPVVLARVFSQDEFGSYKQLFLVFTTLYAIAQVGMAECLYYFLPQRPREAGQFAMNSVLVLGAVGALCAGALAIASPWIGRALSNPLVERDLWLIGLFLVFMLASALLEITMVSQKRFRSASLSYLISDLTRTFFILSPALLFPSLRAVLWGALAFAVLRFAATMLYLHRSYAVELRPSGPLLREQFAWSIPFALAVLVETVQATFHHYAVSFSFDASTFAIYSVACLQIPLVGYAASSAADVLMVRMSESLRERKAAEVLASWNDAVRKLALLFFPFVALLIVAGGDIIAILFSSEYAASAPLFKLAALGIVFSIFPTDAVLRVYGRTRALLWLHGLHLAVLVSLIFVFIAYWGLAGAILVSLVASALGKGAALMWIRSLLKVNANGVVPWAELLGVLLVSLGAGLGTMALRYVLNSGPFAALITSTLAFGVLYVALAALTGVLRRDEVGAFIAWTKAQTQRNKRQGPDGTTNDSEKSPQIPEKRTAQ